MAKMEMDPDYVQMSVLELMMLHRSMKKLRSEVDILEYVFRQRLESLGITEFLGDDDV